MQIATLVKGYTPIVHVEADISSNSKYSDGAARASEISAASPTKLLHIHKTGLKNR